MRVELKLKKTDRIMSPWEISNFLNTLGGKYYKINLLNEIASLMNTNENDIFIMESSFSISTQYSYMSDEYLSLNIEENINKWYYLGVPIPFNMNNPLLYKISIYFKIIRRLNTEFSNYNINSINKKEIGSIFRLILESKNSLEEIDSHIMNLVSEKLDNITAKTEKEIKHLKNIFRKLESIIFVKENEIKNFFEVFESLERPVVGIYNKETNSMKILCHYFISKNSTSKNKLDIKKIEHNSPTFMTLLTGVVFLSALIPCIQAAKLKNKTATSEELKKIEQDIMHEIDELKSIITTNNIDKVSEIKNSIIKESFEKKQNQFYKDVETLLKNTKMLNSDLNINILED